MLHLIAYTLSYNKFTSSSLDGLNLFKTRSILTWNFWLFSTCHHLEYILYLQVSTTYLFRDSVFVIFFVCVDDTFNICLCLILTTTFFFNILIQDTYSKPITYISEAVYAETLAIFVDIIIHSHHSVISDTLNIN